MESGYSIVHFGRVCLILRSRRPEPLTAMFNVQCFMESTEEARSILTVHDEAVALMFGIHHWLGLTTKFQLHSAF